MAAADRRVVSQPPTTACMPQGPPLKHVCITHSCVCTFVTLQEQHSDDHVHSWVQSAAMHAAECSPPASTCPSITSPPIAHSREPTSLESSSNGSSGSAAETIGRAVAASCALKMWREGEGDVQDKLQSVASIAAAVLLANRMSEPGATIKVSEEALKMCEEEGGGASATLHHAGCLLVCTVHAA